MSKDDMFRDDCYWERALQKLERKHCDKIVLQLLTNDCVRNQFKEKVLNGYTIQPPTIITIPKDDGGTREIFCYQGADRAVLAVLYEIYYELFEERVHEKCLSYRKGYNTGKVVRKLSKELPEKYEGWKCDVSKYFDSVSQDKINALLDTLEDKPRSTVDCIVRELYNDNRIKTRDGTIVSRFKSLGQGCALAALFSNLMLRELDEVMTECCDVYYRYCDDFVAIGGEDPLGKAADTLARYGLSLKPEKVEHISSEQWFNFLGFAIKGKSITFSKKFLYSFKKELKQRTITISRKKKRKLTETETEKMILNIYKWLYGGRYPKMGKYFATINTKEDVQTLDNAVKDAIRATIANKCDVGGLGWDKDKKIGAVDRGKGRNVKSNKAITIQYTTMTHLYKQYSISPDLFKAEVTALCNRR